MNDQEKKDEPTEEQKQAVRDWFHRPQPVDEGLFEALARLLAKRETRLRDEVARLEARLSRPQPLGMVVLDENEAMRARIAELERKEAKLTNACQMTTATNKRRSERIAELETEHKKQLIEVAARMQAHMNGHDYNPEWVSYATAFVHEWLRNKTPVDKKDDQ